MTFKELMCSVPCSSPKIIVKREILGLRTQDIIAFYHPTYEGDLRRIDINNYSQFEHTHKYVYAYLSKIRLSDDSMFCFYLTQHGEMISPYRVVPCGKCEICIERKRNSYKQRAQFQTLQDGNMPYFITLTYNENHYTKNVNKNELLSFIKRFKLYSNRYYGCANCKVFAVSEYGKKGRPHYHLLVFGFMCNCRNTISRYRAVRSLSLYCWRDTKREPFDIWLGKYNHSLKFITNDTSFIGAVDVKLCGSIRGSVSYVTKYITKSSLVPDGCTSNFIVSPYKLGVDYVAKYLYPQIEITKKNEVRCNIDGKVCKMHLCNYYINRLYPCVSQLVSGQMQRLISKLLGVQGFQDAYSGVLFNTFDLPIYIDKPDMQDDTHYCYDIGELYSMVQRVLNFSINYRKRWQHPVSYYLRKRAELQGISRPSIDVTSYRQKIIKNQQKIIVKL